MESETVLKNGYKAIVRKAGLLLVLLLPLTALADDQLVRPPELEPDIAFWRSIFAEVSTEQALVHDDRYLNVVYERIEVPAKASPAERRRITERALEPLPRHTKDACERQAHRPDKRRTARAQFMAGKCQQYRTP